VEGRRVGRYRGRRLATEFSLPQPGLLRAQLPSKGAAEDDSSRQAGRPRRLRVCTGHILRNTFHHNEQFVFNDGPRRIHGFIQRTNLTCCGPRGSNRQSMLPRMWASRDWLTCGGNINCRLLLRGPPQFHGTIELGCYHRPRLHAVGCAWTDSGASRGRHNRAVLCPAENPAVLPRVPRTAPNRVDLQVEPLDRNGSVARSRSKTVQRIHLLV
jgi:hypothetical protein